MFLLVCTACFAEPPKTKEDFLVAVRAAYEAKDLKRIHELTWEKGMSDADKKMDAGSWEPMVANIKKIESVTLKPLPTNYQAVLIGNGKRYETTYPAIGMVEINTSGDRGSISLGGPYAVIDGGYYMVTSKSTDLGWKGPHDKMLSVTVTGKGQDKVAIHVKYNASGVDLASDEKPTVVAGKETTPPTVVSGSRFKGVLGQYIEEVTVVSNDDDVDVTLELRDQQYPAEPFYKSHPLQGKGQIVYKKGDKGVSSK